MTRDERSAVREPARLAALRRPAPLGTPDEDAFDRLTRLAARVLGAPLALFSLTDADRQYYKSRVAPAPLAAMREAALSHSFCRYVVAAGRPLVIEDARGHPLVGDSPAIAEVGVVAYAGVPLTTAEGHVLGSFCVLDTRPRAWTDEEVAILTDFAASVMTEIELRQAVREAERQAQAAERDRREKDAILARITDAFFALDSAWRFTYLNPRAEALLQRARGELLGRNLWDEFPEAVGSTFHRRYHEAVERQVAVQFEAFYPPLDTWFEVHAYPARDGLSVSLQEITARREAEAALRRSERVLADFFENGALGLHWVGPDGIILRANRAELELLGYAPEEYIGHHIAEFHADRDAIDDILARLTRAEELHNYEARLRCKDGSIRHVLISSNVYREDGRFVHTRCFTRDITGRKRAEEALRARNASLEGQVAERTAQLTAAIGSLQDEIAERQRAEVALRASEERLRDAQRIAHLGHCWRDFETGESFFSDELYHIHGLHPDRDDLGARGLLALVHPEDVARVEAWMDGVLAGRPSGIDHRIVRPDGEIRWVRQQTEVTLDETTGRPRRLAGTILDITERQRAQEALQHEREFLSAVLENLEDGIVACDAEGVLTLFNRATREFHGVPEAPLPADAWAEHYDLYRPDGRTPLSRDEIPLFRAFRGETVRNAEMVIAPKRGRAHRARQWPGPWRCAGPQARRGGRDARHHRA